MASRLLDETAKGVYIISATPFTDTGDIDFDSTDSLVDFYLESGVNGMTILGVMAKRRSCDRRVGGLHRARAQARQRPGSRSWSASASAGNLNLKRLTDKVMSLGAAGRHGLARFRAEDRRADRRLFRRRGEGTRRPGADRAAGLPAAHPGSYVGGLINKLFKQFPSMKMFKHEDVPGLRKITAVRAAEARGEHQRVSILVAIAACSCRWSSAAAPTAP